MAISEWMEGYEKRRARRRIEIEAALRAGRKVRQLDTIWPDGSPFIAEANAPEYLARHLEAGESGFGFETEIL